MQAFLIQVTVVTLFALESAMSHWEWFKLIALSLSISMVTTGGCVTVFWYGVGLLD